MAEKQLPKLSIVTVVLNAADILEATIKSVLEQDYPHLEYIVVDGGSTDGTLEIIKAYESSITQWVSGPDNGIYDAMNKGLALATGDYIGFKNAGDLYYPGVLTKVMKRSQEANRPAVIYGNTHKVWEQNGKQSITLLRSDHYKLQVRSCVDHRSAFVLRQVHRPFDLQYKIAADYDLFCELLSHGHRFLGMSDVLGSMVPGGTSDTDRVYAEVQSIQAKYFGKAYAWANHARLKASYWRLNLQNSILKKVLGEAGYTKFKTRGNRSK